MNYGMFRVASASLKLKVANPSYNKVEIKKAVEEIFGVQVDSVNTLIHKGKEKRQGYTSGRTAKVKKAVITLKEDSKPIEFFESMIQ